jgi:site-specific DNA recombinase
MEEEKGVTEQMVALLLPVFQVAASRKGSKINIINEPLKGSSLFVVETGEGRTPRPEEAVRDLLQA